MNRLVYKPVGLVAGALAGALAGLLFKEVWKRVAGEDDAPDATDEGRTWTEILVAAALQGAIFAVVKASIDRGGATGIRALTGHWPD
ncbi:DUF4235 domain-containing protein [Allorhizocola rhizosphaerae]|uniref:DUF4235 domain-containing protein n=1 Tax=Allorhizocola rhizosphaerae TaxID=1872709 RepID=UPI000E3E141E|nr:DUF4235 domain-containing protein [Allorhizocola rhizosphaerae]